MNKLINSLQLLKDSRWKSEIFSTFSGAIFIVSTILIATFTVLLPSPGKKSYSFFADALFVIKANASVIMNLSRA